MSRPDDLVGYAYCADLYCPRCILRALTGRDPVGVAGAAFVFTIGHVEAELDHQARRRGIDRTGAEPSDSSEFPAVVLRGDLAPCDHCQGAGQVKRHGRWLRCGDCDDSGSPDRCSRCRELLADVIR